MLAGTSTPASQPHAMRSPKRSQSAFSKRPSAGLTALPLTRLLSRQLISGFTFHQSGHSTLRGVRVARTMVACSSIERRRSPRRDSASSTSHGSRSVLALGRCASSFEAMRKGRSAELTLPGWTVTTTRSGIAGPCVLRAERASSIATIANRAAATSPSSRVSLGTAGTPRPP